MLLKFSTNFVLNIARKGKPSTFKGKRHTEEAKQKMSVQRVGNKSKAKYWHFIKDGIEFPIYNLKDFCKENNLSINCMTRVYQKSKSTYMGFTVHTV